ncbi:MAG TPA: AMP-binding protein [Solirubrobacterales bacterium]|nr:AMP-binding protein [Solirubrobacterales bacterium]
MHAAPTDWLDRSARVHPGTVAVAADGQELDYARLRAEAGAVAAALADDGVGPGDPVAIDLPAGIAHAVALHGAILSGAIVQSLPPAGREGVDVDGATYLDAQRLERARAGKREWASFGRHPSQPLTRVLSSGTSGAPKPVHLTAANHLWSALGSALNLGVERDDRWLCCLPLNHVGGLTILIRSAIYGTGVLLHRGFDVDRVATALEAGEATLASLVPTQLVRLLDAGAAIDRPRLLLVGGGPVSSEVLAEALGRGATVVQTYGLTEACSQVSTLAPGEAQERAGSAGRPLPCTDVRIDGEEIVVRGPTVAPGARGEGGWLRTGDLGRIDPDGYLWVEGRRDDLIVSGGENVRPNRVEEALSSHPGVAEIAVAGREDREWGQVVVAFVVAAGEPDAAELLEHARGQLAPHEVPKRIEFVDALPRTGSGKVLRRLLQ